MDRIKAINVRHLVSEVIKNYNLSKLITVNDVMKSFEIHLSQFQKVIIIYDLMYDNVLKTLRKKVMKDFIDPPVIRFISEITDILAAKQKSPQYNLNTISSTILNLIENHLEIKLNEININSMSLFIYNNNLVITKRLIITLSDYFPSTTKPPTTKPPQ